MYNYAPVRLVKKLLGTTNGGKPLWGGPYEPRRDLPIALAGLFISIGLVIAGFAALKVIGTAIALMLSGVVMFIAMYLIGRLRHAHEDFSVDQWIADKVDIHLTRPASIEGPNPFHPNNSRRSGSKILAPVDVLEDNIIVTDTGHCWAEYRIGNPMEMGLVSGQQKSAVLAEHRALFAKVLRHGAYIAQIKEPDGANELIEDSFTDKDAEPEDLPLLSKLVVDQVDALWDKAQTDPGSWPHHLVYVLAIYVGDDADHAAARRDEIVSDCPFTWKLAPATREEMYWAWYAQCTAGVKMVSSSAGFIPEQLPRVVLDDGAASDSIVTKWTKSRFYRKRDLQPVLKVVTDDGPPSYQVVLTVKIPDELGFPADTTCLALLHEMGEPIKWAIRCSPKDREVAQYENRRDKGTLDSNCDELAPFDDNPNLYAREYELLDLYNAELANPESNALTYTVLISIGAQTAADLKRIAKAVRDVLSPMGVIVNDPQPGKQEELWVAMQPGAPRSPAIDKHAAETTVGEFAEMAPYTTASIGHRTGPMIARNLTSGLGEMVRFAAEKLILAGRAAAIAIVASVGGGKSTLGKMLAIFAHLRGHPWGALDRSDIQTDDHPEGIGEWAKLAEVLPGVQVIDITEPPGSLDPLKVWENDPATASKHTYNMHLKLHDDLDDLQKLALAEALKPKKIKERGLVSQMALGRYLLNQEDMAAKLMGRKILIWEDRPFADAVFKEELDALTLTARGTVIRTHGLSLPDEDKILSKHLFDQLLPEERYASVVYALTSVFLKSVFRRQSRRGILRRRRGTPAYIFVDEAWTITRNPIGMEILEVDIRDGRKHFVIVVLMTHDAERDLEHGAFKLITTKFLGKAEDEELALSNLKWFKAMPINDDIVNDLMAAKNGLFYMSMFNDEGVAGTSEAESRDEETRRQVARIQTIRPVDPEFIKALDTTPTMHKLTAEDLADDDLEAA